MREPTDRLRTSLRTSTCSPVAVRDWCKLWSVLVRLPPGRKTNNAPQFDMLTRAVLRPHPFPPPPPSVFTHPWVILFQLKRAAAWRQEHRVDDILSEERWPEFKELQEEIFWIGRFGRFETQG